MKKLNELYELMIDYKQILKITNSSKDIKALNEFIKLIDVYRDMPYNEFFKNLNIHLKSKPLEANIERKVNSKKFDVAKIVVIYKNFIKDSTLVSEADSQLLEEFNCKYPNIKNIILLKNSDLYEKIHSMQLKNFTLIELRFLLMFYFNTKASSKSTKKDLYDQFLNNIYQSNYLDSLNINYSKKHV